MPQMAKSSLEKGTVTIVNSTVYQPNDLIANPWVIQEVHAEMHNGAPIGVTMKAFKQTLVGLDPLHMGWINVAGNKTGPYSVVLGSLEYPEVKLSPGSNSIHVKFNVTLNSTSHCMYYPSLACFQAYAAMTQHGQAVMKMVADGMKVKALGITVPGSFDTVKYVNCTPIDAPAEPLNVSDVPECAALPKGCRAPASMKCEQLKDFVMPADPTTTLTQAPNGVFITA